MKLLLVSDVHNKWDMLSEAIRQGESAHCEVLLFAGDAHEPHIYAELNAFSGSIHTVYGNNDVPHFVFLAAQLLKPRIKNHNEEMRETFGGKRIYMSHYPRAVAEELKKDPDGFDILIHGHTHVRREERVGTALVLNPGECCGTRYGTPSAAILDTETMQPTFLTLAL